MPTPIHDHLVADDNVTLDGFGYPTSPNVAAMPATGQPGEQRIAADTGNVHFFNPVTSSWPTTTASDDVDKTTFVSQFSPTQATNSAAEVLREDWLIEAYQVVVDTAPTGDETFNIRDETTGVDIATGTLLNGTTTTGLVTLPAAYTLPAGNLMRSNILTVNGSERWALHVWRRTA